MWLREHSPEDETTSMIQVKSLARFVARQDAHIVAVPRVLRRAVAGTFVRAVLVCSVCSLLFAGSLAPPAFAILSFSDVPDSNPYAPGILDLKTRGVITGFTDGTFRPNQRMTRQQFAKVVVKALGLTVTGKEACSFSDVPAGLSREDPLYPHRYIAVCAAAGIMTGKTASIFDPTGYVTRAQLITVVARAAGLVEPPAKYRPSFGSFDPAHYPLARKAAYAGLLDGVRGMGPGFDFFAPASRGEVAEVLTGDRRYGVDYSMTKVEWPAFFRALKASGRDFIGRYLPWKGAAWRQVTRAELEAATAAGVDFFFWFEDSDNHFSARNGFEQGVADAEEALRALERLGLPTDTPVYYTVDFPASGGEEIDAYFRGVNSVVPVSQVGAYGNYITVDWVYQNGLATYLCRSNAWPQSQGQHPATRMHQDVTSLWVGGVRCDRLTVTAADFGQCRRREHFDPRICYEGAWSTVDDGRASWGGYRRSLVPGASMTVYFRGTRLDWLAVRGPAGGVADVYLDGVREATIDLASPEASHAVEVWSTGRLPDGDHMVEIVRSPSSPLGAYLTVDAVDVWGTLKSGCGAR